MKYSVCIIVPIYRTPIDYLKKCIDSILSQTYKDFQVILIDDGAPDSCGLVCDEYANRYINISAIHKKNEGVSAARNSGILASNSEWITCVDSDDWIEPDYLKTFFSMVEEKKADIYITSCYVNYKNTEMKNSFFADDIIYASGSGKERFMLQFLSPGYYGDNLGTTDSGCPWAKFYNAKFLKDNQILFDTRLERMEDNVFNLFAYEKADAIYFRDLFKYHYRKSIFSGFSKYSPNIEKSYELFLEILNDFINVFDKPQVFRDAYKIKVFSSLYVYAKMKCFNKNNPNGLRKRLKEFSVIMKSSIYDDAIKNVRFDYLTKLEKIFVLSLKTGNPIFPYLLFKMKNAFYLISGKSI